MDKSALEAFVAVAELGSFSAASEKLFLTQPAISKRIRSLESQLNCQLFDRVAKKVLLTDQGTILLPQAQQILIAIADASQSVLQSKGVVGQLTLGVSHYVGRFFLSTPLKQYVDTYPDVDVRVEFLTSEEATESVLKGSIDLAIGTLPLEDNPSLTLHRVWKEHLHLVASTSFLEKHNIEASKGIELDSLCRLNGILPTKDTQVFKILEKAFSAKSLSLKSQNPTNNLESIYALVRSGLGWSILPDNLAEDLVKLNVIDTQLSLNRTLGAAVNPVRVMSSPCRAMIELLLED